MATTGTVLAWASGAWEARALALCRGVCAVWPVADEGAAAGLAADVEDAVRTEADEEDAGAAT